MKTLHLPLKRCYFEQIRDGSKPEEYRLCTPFWHRRLEGRTFAQSLTEKEKNYRSLGDAEVRQHGLCRKAHRYLHSGFAAQLLRFAADACKPCRYTGPNSATCIRSICIKCVSQFRY